MKLSRRSRSRSPVRRSFRGLACLAGMLLTMACSYHVPRPTEGLSGPWWQQLVIGAGAGGRPVARAAGSSGPTPTAYGGCGPHARPETGLQGQVPLADQENGRSKKGYRCNLRLVGQTDIEARGANFQLGWYKDCAYVGIVGNQLFQDSPEPPEHPLDGVAVIDASDPARPRVERILQSPMGRTQHEAVEVNARRGMLVLQIGGLSAQWIEIYDVSEDCRKPKFKGRYDAGRPTFHGQRISRDGNTIYASDFAGPSFLRKVLHVIDVSDMKHPKLITAWSPEDETPPRTHAIHDLDVSPDGRRAYLGATPPSATQGSLFGGGPSSSGEPTMVVLDTSDIQKRRANPDLEVVSHVERPNFGHTVKHARIDGRRYVISSGESPFGGENYCPWAWGDIIDIGNERNPKTVAELKLEVNEESNCSETGPDDAVYSIHYIGVDDERDTKKVFYSYYTGGLRVFDVSRPRHPKEIAYYHPPPTEDTVFEPVSPFTGDRQTPEWDSVTSDIRYRPENGHIWFVSIAGGFQIVKLTGDARGGADTGERHPRPRARKRDRPRR